MNLLPIKAVLFDMDGTLVETLEDMMDALNQVLVTLGLPLYTPSKMQPLITHGSKAMMKSALGNCSEDELVRHQQRMLEIYHDLLPSKTKLYPGISNLLNHLDEEGIPWGIVTNRIERFTYPLLSKLQLKERAKVIVCADTYHIAKPHPLPINQAIETLGCSRQECIYIGDAPTDIEAGQRAGIRTFIAGYGYCPEEPHLEHWGASGIIRHSESILSELLKTGLSREC